MFTGRHLLNKSEIEMKPIGENEDAYDEDGNMKKGFCVRPAIEQFPRPWIGQTGRKFGGLLLYIFFACYMFAGLAIVCDDFFVPALDKLSDGKICDIWFISFEYEFFKNFVYSSKHGPGCGGCDLHGGGVIRARIGNSSHWGFRGTGKG